jgi:hypothetical protein
VIAHHLSHQQVLERLCEQVRFARRRFGHDEVIDFLAVLFGYAISGERALSAFYERLHPFAPAFMALFGRDRLPVRSTGTAPHGGGQFGQLSHSLDSMGDSPSPSLYIWSSPFSPFQTARIVLALHVFVFLLVVCLLLASFEAWASLLVPSSVFPLKRWGHPHHSPPSPQTTHST